MEASLGFLCSVLLGAGVGFETNPLLGFGVFLLTLFILAELTKR